jgi:hypothetical protein
VSLDLHPSLPSAEEAAPRRGPLKRAVGWVQRDHLRRGPLPVMAGAVVLAEVAHHIEAPAMLGLPLTAAATIGMCVREMNLPGKRRPGRAAIATAASGLWLTGTTAWGVTAGVEGAPGLMSALGAATAGLTYWAYRRDPRIAEAIAWENARIDWHRRAPLYGLSGSHLLDWRETRLGEQFEIDTRGTGKRASQLAGSDLEERIAEVEMLATSRVSSKPGGIAGRLLVTIRYKDPWAAVLPHPLLDATPEIVLPEVADVREPIIIGMDPETGRPLTVVQWDEEGAKRLMIVAITGAGKSVTLNSIIERLTAADNAFVIGINVSKAKEMRRWRPALGASACGPAQRQRAFHLLRMARHIIDYRGMQEDGDEATVEPTPTTPLVPIVVDEMDELLRHNDRLGMATRAELEYVSTKGRSEGVSWVLVGTRGTASYTGGGSIRNMADQAILGRVARRSEMAHVAGELGMVLPDMAKYGEGHAGVQLVADLSASRWGSGRAWYLKSLTDVDRLARGRRAAPLEPGLVAYLVEQMGDELVADLLGLEPPSRAVRPRPALSLQPAAPPVESAMPNSDDRLDRAAEQRAQAKEALAAARLDTSLTEGERRALAITRRKEAAQATVIDDELMTLLMAMISRPEGASTREIERAMENELGRERGLSRNGAWRCLDKLRFDEIAEIRGKGPAQRWHLVEAVVEPAAELPDAPARTVEQITEEAEEQAEDEALDTAGEHEE